MTKTESVDDGSLRGSPQDLDLATRPVRDSAGNLTITLDPEYDGFGPLGGILAAIALRGAASVASLPKPLGIQCSFIEAATHPAPILVDAQVVRASRRSEAIAVELTQNGTTVLRAEVRTRDDFAGLAHDDATMPKVEKPGALIDIELLNGGAPLFPPILERIQQRPTVWLDDFPPLTPADPVVRTWCRFRPTERYDDHFTDASRSLVLIDVFSWGAAATPHVADLRYRGVSADLSVAFCAPNADPWLLIEAASPLAADGVAHTVSRVWDAKGILVASSLSNLICL
jgi:acyl-CoA thioesterase